MRILIAEDDPVLADGLCRALRRACYAVDHVKTGSDADSAARTQLYDLKILGIGLPKMSGHEVLKRLRSRTSGVNTKLPVLILTTMDDVEDRARKPGADAAVDRTCGTHGQPVAGADPRGALRRGPKPAHGHPRQARRAGARPATRMGADCTGQTHRPGLRRRTCRSHRDRRRPGPSGRIGGQPDRQRATLHTKWGN